MLSRAERTRLATLAGVMIPGGAGMPGAGALALHLGPADAVLRIDPARLAGLRRFLALPGPVEVLSQIEALAQIDADAFRDLGVVLANAYFMHPATRAAIGYPGQQARDASGGLTPQDEALLAPVIARGPIYR